jgi:uncharacterized protein YdbL (DUF1318 family)
MDNPAQLTVVDLDSLKDIINIACQRGAFQANEMKSIGEVYERLDSFLTAIKTQAQAQAEAQSATQQGETND